MGVLTAIWRAGTGWYISLLAFAVVGTLVGYFVFFEIFPGKPKISIIDLPIDVITEEPGFTISAFLDFARRDDDIKAVVIRISSRGSSGAIADRLLLEVRKLREEKPVVITMGNIVASGAYMMSLGGNYLYASPGSWVGSVGVLITNPGPVIPRPADERVISTGPHKLDAGGRRYFAGLMEQLKENFYQMVVAERGQKLQITREELLEGRIYNGNESVRLGLVDALGGDTETIQKAASLAGISSYDVVDVNVEVFRIFSQKLVRIIEPLMRTDGVRLDLREVRPMIEVSSGTDEVSESLAGMTNLDMIRRLYLPSGLDEVEDELLEDLGLDIETPRVFYLYLGYLGPAQ